MMELKVIVNTIYPSFMGEVNQYGIGAPCVFVRMAGCNLRCYGGICDTPEALLMTSGKQYTLKELIEEVGKYTHTKLVCITGGEPLLQPMLMDILTELSGNGYFVVVETNGTISTEIFKNIPNIGFVIDYKLPSTGMTDRMVPAFLRRHDILKFVVRTYDDYEAMLPIISEFAGQCEIAVGLYWGDSEFTQAELAGKILADKLPVYFNMQTHKMVTVLSEELAVENLLSISIPKDL